MRAALVALVLVGCGWAKRAEVSGRYEGRGDGGPVVLTLTDDGWYSWAIPRQPHQELRLGHWSRTRDGVKIKNGPKLELATCGDRVALVPTKSSEDVPEMPPGCDAGERGFVK